MSNGRKEFNEAVQYLIFANKWDGSEQTETSGDTLVYLSQILLQMDVNFTEDLPARAAMNIKDGRGQVYIKPSDWVGATTKYNAHTLAHELLHMIMDHIPRSMDLDTSIDETTSFNATAVNIAMDCAINQLCGLEPTMKKYDHVTHDAFCKMIEENPNNVERNREFEYYFGKMKENSKKLKKKYGEGLEGLEGKTPDDHDKWKEGSSNKDLSKDIIKDMMRKAKDRNAGKVPSDIQEAYDKMLETKVNWRQQLTNFCRQTIPVHKRRTRSKRNRRLGIIEQGRKKEYEAHLAIGLDTSGSMSMDDLRECWAQMYKISKSMRVKMTVIECDCDVQSVYEFDPNQEFKVRGRGGTYYQPVLDKAAELGCDGLVFMGDMGAFDKVTKPKYPVMWAIIGSYACNPPAEWGKVINVNDINGKK